MADVTNSDFARLSQLLTGFGPQTITMAMQSCDYQSIIESFVGSRQLKKLMAKFTELETSGASPQAIADALLVNSTDPKLEKLAQALMKFWYLGIWVQPFNATVKGKYYPQARPPGFERGSPPIVPSIEAYQQGLAWKAAQTHPTGISHDRTGSWQNPPAALKFFVQ